MTELVPNRSNNPKTRNDRRVFVLVVLYCLGIGLIARAVILQLYSNDFLISAGNNRTMRNIEIPSVRGMILDRHAEALAVSTAVSSVWCDPLILKEYADHLGVLAQTLEMPLDKLQTLLKRKEKFRFVWLKRRLAPHEANPVIALNIPGVFVEREYKRFYPDAEITAHILGFTNSDDDGLEGMELTFQSDLKGKVGQKQVLRDSRNQVVEQTRITKEAEAGKDITLTIDRRIQLVAYRALKTAVLKHEAVGGSVMVIDAKTGEVLAMVNQPSGNPNNPKHRRSGLLKNRAITDIFEPGSTIKPFVVALGLESKKWTPSSIIETGRAFMVNGNKISDVARSDQMDVTTVLTKSSNIGAAKIALSLPPNALWELYRALGIGAKTSLGLIGEQSGVLGDVKVWERNAFEHATKAFGYGISVNTAQIAQMYAVLANRGVYKPLTILKSEVPTDPKLERKIFSEQVSFQILTMLEEVVSGKGGSGFRAAVPKFRIAGKSGTIRKIEDGRYSTEKHRGFFAGIAPVSNPQYVIIVMIDEPKKSGYYGGAIAAPVFSEIMGNTLRILGVKPDALIELPKLQLISG